jgi:hypothetical protein
VGCRTGDSTGCIIGIGGSIGGKTGEITGFSIGSARAGGDSRKDVVLAVDAVGTGLT